MSSIANVRLGQCDIEVNGVDLGHTKGGVELTVKNEITEVTVDKYGSTPAKAYHKGTRVEVKATLSEFDFVQMEQLINGASKAGTAASATIVFGSPSNGDTITVDGTTFTKAASASGNSFSTAAELAALIDALPRVGAANVTGTITVTAVSIGTWGNQIAITKTGSALTPSAAALSGGDAQLNIGSVAGTELEGVSLILHPSQNDDDSQDIELYKAVVMGSSTFPFKVDAETVYEVTFFALVSPDDADEDDNGFLAKLGIESEA